MYKYNFNGLFKILKGKKRHITGCLRYAARSGGSGFGFARSVATLVSTQNLRHILGACKLKGRVRMDFRLFGLLIRRPKRRKQPERYMPFTLNLVL
jgi:hypothetical protein